MEELKVKSISRWVHDNIALVGLDNPRRSAYMTLRELIENSLDSCELGGYYPTIKVSIDQSNGEYIFQINDNGVGMKPDDVPTAFGVVLSSTKYVVRQSRGILGIGGKGVVQLAYTTTQKPIVIATALPFSPTYRIYKLAIDIENNRPVILQQVDKSNNGGWHGMIIKLQTKADFVEAMKDIKRYLSLTSMVCPYAEIKLEFNGSLEIDLPRTISELPPKPEVMSYHPYGLDVPILEELIRRNSFETVTDMLVSLQRVGKGTIKDFDKFCSQSASGLDLNKDPRSLSNGEMVRLVGLLHSFDGWYPPDMSGLSPVTESILTKGVGHLLSPDGVGYVSRKGVYGAHGFVLEIVIIYGGGVKVPRKEYGFEVFRFANKIPLLTEERNCLLSRVVEEQDFRRYAIEPFSPLAFVIHLASTKVPYKTAGKEYIADNTDIRRELDLGVKEVLRQVKHILKAKARVASELYRQSQFALYLPIIARHVAYLTKSDEKQVQSMLDAVVKRK